VLALAFVYLWNRDGWSVDGLFVTAYVWLAALITVIDLEHRLILIVVMGPAILLALIEAALTSRLPFWDAVRGGLIGFGFVFGIYLLGEGFRRLAARLRGETVDEVAFGFGDVMLATFAGVVVGGAAGRIGLVLVVMIIVGGVGAFVYLIYRRFIRRDYSLYTAIPYGPNIIIGMLAVLIWPEEVRNILFGVQWAIYGGS
jgi:prepilin signal peptidase PulO-like enzyme (type II secretory pathway)